MRVFKLTIESLQKKLAQVSLKFRYSSTTGANTRLLNPEKVSAYEEMIMLERILLKASSIPVPKDMSIAGLGHEIKVVDSYGKEKLYHLGADLDVLHFPPKKIKKGRLLSTSSELGSALAGKKVGTIVFYRNSVLKVISIEPSSLIGAK